MATRPLALLLFPVAAITLAHFLSCGGAKESGLDAAAPGTDDASAVADAAQVGMDAATGEVADASEPPDAEADPVDAGPPCSAQSECASPVRDQVASVCQGGHCTAPGLTNPDGSLQMVRVKLMAVYNDVFTQDPRPQVQLTRLIMPLHTDGTAVTCADLRARSGDTQATRSRLDVDPQVNQAFRSLTVLNWSGSPQGQTLFNFYFDLPRGDGYLLYGEAWYGAREGNDPTGMRATTACVENVRLAGVPEGAELGLSFQPQ